MQTNLDQDWDVIVVGAGPAGSLAAREMARQDLSVLLVDKENFPRPKVCGSCLNAGALSLLEKAGLGELPWQLGAQPLRHFLLGAGGKKASLELPLGAAISREALDNALVQKAVESGACFAPRTFASFDTPGVSKWSIQMTHEGKVSTVQAKRIVVADGMAGRSLEKRQEFKFFMRPNPLVGIGASLKEAPDSYEEGIIYMATAKGGYVGAVRVEDDSLNIAAALAPQLLKEEGPAHLVERILKEADFTPLEGLDALTWRGTVPLTRTRRRIAKKNLFVVGDAAAFSEPFTGEGITLAFSSALKVSELITGVSGFSWTPWYQHFIGTRHLRCGQLTQLLRHPQLTQAAVWLLSQIPTLANPLVKQITKA